jgi:hypothetical protein
MTEGAGSRQSEEAISHFHRRGDFLAAYHKRLTGGDEEMVKAAKVCTQWEMGTTYMHQGHGGKG